MDQYFGHYSLMFIASLITTAIITPPFIRLANNQDIVDQPGLHKTHEKSKPLLGGLAIFLGFILSIFLFLEVSPKITSVLSGAIVLVVIGIYDDINNLNPLYKLFGQILAASIVILYNIEHYHVFLDTLGRYYISSFFTLILLAGWIVLMINAFNLIDGLDGLASGTAVICFLAMALVTWLNGGSMTIFALHIAGAGACAGFLFYNFNPARIFMGDSGSMLIGYLLAATYLLSVNGNFDLSLVLGSLFIFAYPAMDTGFAIFRRIKNRTSILKADRCHIHHILLALGFSVRKTVLILYLVSLFFAAMAVVLLCMDVSSRALVFTGLLTIGFSAYLMRHLYILAGRNGLNGTQATGFDQTGGLN